MSQDRDKKRHDDSDAKLDPTERYILDHIPQAYHNGLKLKRWWEQAHARDRFREKFQLVRDPDRPNTSFGFLDSVRLEGSDVPILGEYQHDFYDQPKLPAGRDPDAAHLEWTQAQLREFALRYFLHISSLRTVESYPQRTGPRADPALPFLSACSKPQEARDDIGFFQLAYKSKESGKIRAFKKEEQSDFVDVREIGPKYDWILAKARLFQFNLTFNPFGEKFFPITLADPNEYLYLLFTPYFVVDDEKSERRVRRPDGSSASLVSEFGFGFSIVANPSSKDVFTEGPQVFDTGIQYFKFQLFEDGQIWVDMIFLANQLTHIFQFPIDPIYWTFKFGEIAADLTKSSLKPYFQTVLDRLPLGPTIDPVFESIRWLNTLTGGIAAKDYCLSIDEIQRFVLIKHEEVFSAMIGDTSRTWRQIPDWLDTEALPHWVRFGQKA